MWSQPETRWWASASLIPIFHFGVLFRENITTKTPSNSTKKLYWLFTKGIIALTTSPTSLSWPISYHRATVIYVLVSLPSVVSFYKKKPPSLYQRLLNISLIIVGFLFSFKLKIIPNYCSRCVSISFKERIDSYPIRLVSFSEWNRFIPFPFWNSCRKKSVPIKTKGLSDVQIATER